MDHKRRKRVLLVIRYPVGGIRTYLKYIYSQNIFDDIDFTVVCPDPNMESYFGKIFYRNSLEYITCNNSRDMFTSVYIYLSTKKVNLVHSHGFTAGSICSLATIIKPLPHIMTAHDVFLTKQFEGVRGTVKKRILGYLFSKITFIHTVSHDATDNFMQYMAPVNEDQIKCIPHGIDAETFFHAEKTALDIQLESDNTCLIGFFGRFMAQKGFKYLVDAIEIIVKENRTIKQPLVLTFDWGGFVREEYDLIKRRGLSSYFRMMDYTENVPAMIKSMDIVAMPSLWESSGLLAMESLVAGVPIVGASCIGLREVLADTPAIIVPPADSSALAEALAKEINTPTYEAFQKYSIVARKKFSLARPALELKKLYDQLLSI